LDKAIDTLRYIVPDQLSLDQLTPAEQVAKRMEMNDALKIIEASGKHGVLHLKEEIKETEFKKDNYFKLIVSKFLWESGGLEEAGSIGEI
jgi:hypothetical protein